jgi:hypothetical protein
MVNGRSPLLTRDSTGTWQALGGRLRGDLVRPADPGYEFAKQLQGWQYDSVQPQGIAYCQHADDVRTCLEFAQHNGIAAHVRSGGHSMGGWSTGEGLVIDLSRLNQVSVGESTVRLGAGTRSLEALDALKARNTQIVTGTFPTVGAGGFLTGGGLGWQTRKFGVGSDRIVAATVMLADGRVVRCSATEEPDLYWAVRGGGGGNFGIVLDFEVLPIDAPLLVAYETIWRIDDAPAVLAAWQQWCVEGPNELGSSLVVLPPFGPDGTPIVKAWGVFLGTKADMDKELDRLAELAGATPINRTVQDPAPYSETMHECLCEGKTVDECQRAGHNPVAKGHRHPFTVQSYHLTNRAVTLSEAQEMLTAWDGGINRERYLLCIAVGGVANEVGRTETAYVHRDAQFLMGYQIALRDKPPAADAIAEITAWSDHGDTLLEPLACGSYINFPSTRATEDWGRRHYGENFARLTEIKRQYDPEGFFRHARSIPSGK